MKKQNQSTSDSILDNLMNEALNTLEDIIDGRSNLKTPKEVLDIKPLDIRFYIDYKQKGKVSLSQLIDNTIEKYTTDVYFSKKEYDNSTTSNNIFSHSRYKNFIFKNKLAHIKSKFLNNHWKLCQVDKVVNTDKPYLLYFYHLLNSINNVFYIYNAQFNSNVTKYKYSNFETSLGKKIEEAQNKLDSHEVAKLEFHKSIIETHKDNHIEGSLVISILNKIDNTYCYVKNEIQDSEYPILKQSEFFNKSFEKVNFTLNDLYNGYAQLNYWNYAHSDNEFYKKSVYEVSEKIKGFKTKTPVYNIPKEIISNHILELYNFVFEKDVIKQIRGNKVRPKILKYYDGIEIPTTKNISKLENEWFDFLYENILSQRPKIKQFVKDHRNFTFQSACQIRATFY